MDPQELLATAGRALAVYALMLIVMRVLGKRTIGNFSAFDLIIALMLGEVVDEMIYGDVTMAQGAVAILVVAGAKYLTAWLTYLDKGMNRVLEGSATAIVDDGEIRRDSLRKELMNDKEVMAALRLHGIRDMREVKLACLEVDGLVSVLKHDWAETVQKSDIDDKAKKKKKETAGAGDEPPDDKRTDTPRALGHEV
jgi:uncharacterized membrane protein YcaP (DUF421 family)